jgi:cell fate regulator YaaT (PSP1 superfamily)
MAQVRFFNGNLAALCDARDLDLSAGDKVMVEWEEALKMGSVTALKEVDTGDSPPKHYPRVIRKATEADLDYESRKEPKQRDVFRACSAKIKEAGLPMNLIDVEYIPGSNKFICSFTADGRVDFRNLVKTLASDFHSRVEMKQIGARNRSKLIGGIGRCGRILCCSSFLQDFDPITVRMAKDQGLSLDPTKISGVCGRLMCCLSYEHATYCDYKKNLPKCGKKVTMECGCGKITKQDILRQRIWVKIDASGKEVEVSLEDMKKEGLLKPAKKK